MVQSTCRSRAKEAIKNGYCNVLMCGGSWQLPSPDGGYLSDTSPEFIRNARKYAPGPTIAHGQSLLWGGPEYGLQGVTEVVKCEQCDDPWLREVQEEIRYGRMTGLTHRVLMGSGRTNREAGVRERRPLATSNVSVSHPKSPPKRRRLVRSKTKENNKFIVVGG